MQYIYYNIQFTTVKEVKINIGQWCKLLRKEHNLSRKQLAGALSLNGKRHCKARPVRNRREIQYQGSAGNYRRYSSHYPRF